MSTSYVLQVATTQDVYAEQLAAIPQIAKLGNVFKSSPPVELTESETEYVVRCVKHIFPGHLVFQVRDGRVCIRDIIYLYD